MEPTLTLVWLGGGVALGFIVGYALKKILKLVLVILGLFIIGLLALNYLGLISVNYSGLERATGNLLGCVKTQFRDVWSWFLNNLAFSGGFIVGLAIGLKKG